MVQGLEKGHGAALFIGYHGRAGGGGNPLAHTMSSQRLAEVRINGEPASEYRIHAWACALEGVPVAFVSGDRALCDEVAALAPATATFATKWGEGGSQHSLHPEAAIEGIRSGVCAALDPGTPRAPLALPESFDLEIRYKDHTLAYARSFYPGASCSDPHTVRFESVDYFEVLRALLFLM
jgi:D-amino peptidase